MGNHEPLYSYSSGWGRQPRLPPMSNLRPRIYLTHDPRGLCVGAVPTPAPVFPCDPDLRDASLRLRVLAAACLREPARQLVLQAADQRVLPSVPARRRRGFRAALGAILNFEEYTLAAVKRLLACPCIGSLSETLLRLADEALGQLGSRAAVICHELDESENQAMLRLVLHTSWYEHLEVLVGMREATFQSTSIQNWSHLQAVLCRV